MNPLLDFLLRSLDFLVDFACNYYLYIAAVIAGIAVYLVFWG